MKKRIGALVLLISLILALASCADVPDEKELISQSLGRDVSAGQTVDFYDTHGGFLGDGETFAKIVFSDDSFAAGLGDAWMPLPLPTPLHVVAYGGELPNGESWEAFVRNADGERLIPAVTDGFYFFEDRHSESRDASDPASVLYRSSMNFTLAIYDADTTTLYYYEIDT